MDIPYLIQRVIRRREPRESSKGIDKEFSFDYMGSSEFEFGTLPDALKRLRAHKGRKKWIVTEVNCVVENQQYTAWLVGGRGDSRITREILVDQISLERKYHFKESTMLHLAYCKEWQVGGSPGETPVNGWWAVGADIPFAFFMEKADAELWLKLIGGR
jgi:hypothetical protein